MLTIAALAALMMLLADPAHAEPALEGPVAYSQIIAEEQAQAEAQALLEASLHEAEPDWRLSARLYHAGGGGATGMDSLGCQPIAMRTVAVDPSVVPRRTRLYIRETVGMRLADGSTHDGFWYASDTGGAIKGAKIDLYTGHGRGSMAPVMPQNMSTLTVVNAGTFDGCPPAE